MGIVRAEIRTLETTRMSLEDVLLSETSRSQKDRYQRFHSCEAPGVVRVTDRKEDGGFQGPGTGVTVEWGEF